MSTDPAVASCGRKTRRWRGSRLSAWRRPLAAAVVGLLLAAGAVGAIGTAPASAAVNCNGRLVSWVEYYQTSSGVKVSMQPTVLARALRSGSDSGMWDELLRCTPVPWRNFTRSWTSSQVTSAYQQMSCHNHFAWWFPGTYDYEQWRPVSGWWTQVRTMCNP